MDKTGGASSESEKSLFDVGDILNIIRKRKWLVILPLILVTVVTAGGSYLITPEYESSVIVWVGSRVRLSNELQRLLGDAPGYSSNRNRSNELRSMQNEITSSPFISQLVRELQLDNDAGLENAALKVQASQPSLSIEQIKFDILLENLRDKIQVSFAGQDQIRITVQSADQFQARDMAQKLAEIFISEKMKQELGSVRVSQDFSYEQLAKYEKDLREKIDQKTRLEKEFINIQLDARIASDENRKEINSEISGLEMEIEDKKNEERVLQRQLSDIPRNDLKLSDASEQREIKSGIKEHISSLGSLMLNYTLADPEILNHKVRLFNLIDELEDLNRNEVADKFAGKDSSSLRLLGRFFNIKDELDILYSRVNALKLARDDITDKVNLIPDYQARLDQLNREIVAARELRDTFKNLKEGSQISQALLRESQYKVIEPAKIPLNPFKPQRKKIVLLGFLLGLAIGGGAVLLAEILDKSFRNVEDVEQALGLKVIGVIPQIESLKKLKVRK
jgi:polysaccharide biosynthesis transport protein